MFIGDCFHSPLKRITAFAESQVHLYRHDVSLQDYFLPLQLDTLTHPRANSGDLRANGRFRTWAIRGADTVSRFSSLRKIKADVLLCWDPYFVRQSENRLFLKTLLGLAQTGARIVCLLPKGVSCRGEAYAQLRAIGRSAQVTFVDPAAPLNSIDARLRSKLARVRGRLAWEKTVEILEPYGLSPSSEVKANFEHTAYFVESWERLAPWIEFEAVVARIHWHALCSPVCRTALQRGKPVITFQQGVIGHSLDIPVTASKYVAFGQPSASFLTRLNHEFFRTVEMPEPPVEYVLGGSLVDTLIPLADQFEHQTVLLVDVPATPGDFYGMEGQSQALLKMAARLMEADLPLRRLIIRPHPYWSNLDLVECKRLAREFPEKCELSHPAWTLDDDLGRSSIVAGITSGVLTVASACGLPAIFLQTQQGFATADLACFSPSQTLQPEAAFNEISEMLRDRKTYEGARARAQQNGCKYYDDGKNVDFGAAFFDRLLRTEAASTLPQHHEGQ